jgi:DNA-binding NarL/FixJ family response regulator
MIEGDASFSPTAERVEAGWARHETLLVLRGWKSLSWSPGADQNIWLMRKVDGNGPCSLTSSEFALTHAVAMGRAVKQAAGDFGLRWGAARAAISRALQKLGLHSGAQLPAFWHGLSGAASISPANDGTELLVFESRLQDHGLALHLTSAERELLHAVLMGQDNQHIASRRGTSARTVANQLAILFRKFGVSSKAELAARALVPRFEHRGMRRDG